VIGADKNLSVRVDIVPLVLILRILAVEAKPPKPSPASHTNMFPLPSKATLLGSVKFHNTGFITYPFVILKFEVIGGLPEFTVDAASSGGIGVSCCALFPAVIPYTVPKREFVVVNIDIINVIAIITEQIAISFLTNLVSTFVFESR
jgi:hypothetical protein